MSGRASTRGQAKLIKQFITVTGATREVAKSMLEACNGNVQLAISMHLDGGDSVGKSSMANGDGACSSSESNAKPKHSDETDEVRAPIPPKRQVLVDGSSFRPAIQPRTRASQSLFTQFRDFQAEGRLGGSAPVRRSAHASNLSDLFSPPANLMFRGTLENVRDAGTTAGKWVLIDVQDVQNFQCQVLNRDLWKDSDVKTIITDHFLLWQVYHDSIDGQRYQQFYPISSYPHIAIMDPRTGERLEVFSSLTPEQFRDISLDFLSRHSLCPSSASPAVDRSSANAGRMLSRQPRAIIDAEEEAQVASAIAASLADSTPICLSDGSSSDSYHSCSQGSPSISSDDEVIPVRRKRKAPAPSPRKSKRFKTKATTQTDGQVEFKRLESDPAVRGAVQALAAASVDDKPSSLRQETPTLNTARRKEAAVLKKDCILDAKEENNKAVSTTDMAAPVLPSSPLLSWSAPPGVPSTRLLIRLPDGSRHECRPPASALVQDLWSFVSRLGFSPQKYSLVTPFPRRSLADADCSQSLQSKGLTPSGTICVEEKDFDE